MATKKPSVTKVRVLVDSAYGQVNDIVEIAPESLDAALESGQVDAAPEAVAYAETLKG